jgi:hypothetical protein
MSARGGNSVLKCIIRQWNSFRRPGGAAGQHLDRDAVRFLPEWTGTHSFQTANGRDNGRDRTYFETQRTGGRGCNARPTPVGVNADHCGQHQLRDICGKSRFPPGRVDCDDAAVGQQHTEHRRDHRWMVSEHQPDRRSRAQTRCYQMALDTMGDIGDRLPIGPGTLVLDCGSHRIERQDRTDAVGDWTTQAGAAASSVAAGITSWANSFIDS